MKAYLAGPDVFEQNAKELGEEKKQLCADYGFTGIFPLDNEIEDFQHDEPTAYKIAAANEQLMEGCDVIFANMQPWHGPSMDVGTAFEIGYMRALKKPIFGYSSDLRKFSERVQEHVGYDLMPTITGGLVDMDHRTVETFGELTDNLMMIHAINESGGSLHETLEDALAAAAAWRESL